MPEPCFLTPISSLYTAVWPGGDTWYLSVILWLLSLDGGYVPPSVASMTCTLSELSVHPLSSSSFVVVRRCLGWGSVAEYLPSIDEVLGSRFRTT